MDNYKKEYYFMLNGRKYFLTDAEYESNRQYYFMKQIRVINNNNHIDK